MDITAILGNPLAALNARPDTKKTREKSPAGTRGPSFFSAILEQADTEAAAGAFRELPVCEETVNLLLDKVRNAGDDLRQHPHPDEILDYKQAVRDFMRYVVENGYAFTEIQGVKRKVKVRGEVEWKEQIYHQVQVVDQKLEKLCADILAGQAAQLHIIARLEEINGLLVDMVQ